MKYLSLLFCVLGFVCSCRQKAQKPVAPNKRDDSIAAAKEFKRYWDSVHTDFIQSMHEPFIDTYRHEVYRYWFSIVFHPDYIFRIENINGKKILFSKWVQDECPQCAEGIPIIVRGNERRARYGDVLDTTVQELTLKQWQTFSELLEGSYYRRLREPACSDGVMDGSSLTLETMSLFWCGLRDSLTYYRVSVHVPREGSFKEACKYLSRISLLTKGKQIQQWIWMY